MGTLGRERDRIGRRDGFAVVEEGEGDSEGNHDEDNDFHSDDGDGDRESPDGEMNLRESVVLS